MSYRIYLSPPDVGPLEESFVVDAIRSGWVAPLGPHVEEFEREISSFVGAQHAVALSSGTAGLHLGLLALGVGPDDEVVVPTLTFAATAFAVTYTGARPVFIDSERQSWNLDPTALADLLERRARSGRLPAALIAVDIFGQSADYEQIEEICARYGVPVLEDAAEGLGATNGSRKVGSFGRAAVFSFNGNKIMTTSGGGMFVTDEPETAAQIRHLATQARLPRPWYEHDAIGYNYRLSNLLAALGRAQLRRLPEMIERRRAIRDRYRAHVTDVAGVEILDDAPWGEGNAWLTLALFDDPNSATRVRLALADRGIESRPTWKPMHLQPVFAHLDTARLPVAEDLFARGLCLPSGSVMDDETVDDIAECITSVVTSPAPTMG